MRRILCLAGVFLGLAPAFGGNTVRVTSPHFSFLISEPEGWALDLESANQIAHFVLTPQGSSWRNSDLVIFGRFEPSGTSETLDEFLKADEARFDQQCHSPKMREVHPDLKASLAFRVRSYLCPGTQDEVVAVAQLPRYFAVFVLSAQLGGRSEEGMAAFKEVLEGFIWLGRPARESRSDQIP